MKYKLTIEIESNDIILPSNLKIYDHYTEDGFEVIRPGYTEDGIIKIKDFKITNVELQDD